MRDLFITCPRGFETLLEKELRSLGITKVFPRFCGVLIPKSIENVFIANYESRIATRVLWPILEFPCTGKTDLYAHCRKINWSEYLHCKKTIAIDANVQHETLKNSLFAALVVKDSICDFFRDKTGERPSVDIKNPDIQLNLFIQRGQASLYLDTSGAPLHKRGWRTESTEASLHESLAAALLLSHYRPGDIFCDPFCGSGTFLIEAALIATNTPPGFIRKKWGFFNLPLFEMSKWKLWKQKRDALRVPLQPGTIFGSDKSREAADICKQNIRKAGFLGIEVAHQEIAFYTPPRKPTLILTNPPYGHRLERSNELLDQVKSFLHLHAEPSASVHLLCPQDLSAEALGKKASSSFQFKNGGLSVHLLSLTP